MDLLSFADLLYLLEFLIIKEMPADQIIVCQCMDNLKTKVDIDRNRISRNVNDTEGEADLEHEPFHTSHSFSEYTCTEDSISESLRKGQPVKKATTKMGSFER